jgi:hypothetical protein
MPCSFVSGFADGRLRTSEYRPPLPNNRRQRLRRGVRLLSPSKLAIPALLNQCVLL